MSNQGPTVETDPKKIESLLGTIKTAVLEYEQAYKQYTEKGNSRIKEIMLERMNRFISNALRYAMQGDPSTFTGAYPQWVLDNQEQMNKWLEHPNVTDDVKEEIRAANRKAMGQPDPQPQPQAQSSVNDLSALLKTAKNMREFISIIENYPNDMLSKDGQVLDKITMLRKLREFSSDPEILAMLASSNPPLNIFAGSNITSNYEMRDMFLQFAKVEYQNNVVFPQALKSAKTVDEFINVIKNHPYELESSDGRVLDKNFMLNKILELSTDEYIVKLIAEDKAPPVIFGGTNITRQYGMREKFIELMKVKYNTENNNKFSHLKSEVATQVANMFKHFGTHYNLDTTNGVYYTFPILNLSNDNRKAFESVLQKSNIQFESNDYSLKVSIPPAQFAEVIAVLKEATKEIENSQKRLQQKINMANSLPEIIKVIQDHDGMMLSKGGIYLDKQAQLEAIENLQNPNPHFTGSKVTSNYGLENKVKSFIQQEHAAKNAPPAKDPNTPLPQAPQQAQGSQQPPQNPQAAPSQQQPNPQAQKPPLPPRPAQNPQAQRPQVPPRPPLNPEAQAPKPQQQNAQAQPPSPQQLPQAQHFDAEAERENLYKNLAKQQLHDLFNVNKDMLMNDYQAIRAGHGLSGWVNARVKDVGKALGDQGKLREKQINDLAKAFKLINSDDARDTREKALDMYAYLSKLAMDVGLESSTFKKMSPAIIKLCEHYMKKIEFIVGNDINSLKNSPALLERANQVKQKVASLAEPAVPNAHRNKMNK